MVLSNEFSKPEMSTGENLERGLNFECMSLSPMLSSSLPRPQPKPILIANP